MQPALAGQSHGVTVRILEREEQPHVGVARILHEQRRHSLLQSIGDTAPEDHGRYAFGREREEVNGLPADRDPAIRLVDGPDQSPLALVRPVRALEQGRAIVLGERQDRAILHVSHFAQPAALRIVDPRIEERVR